MHCRTKRERTVKTVTVADVSWMIVGGKRDPNKTGQLISLCFVKEIGKRKVVFIHKIFCTRQRGAMRCTSLTVNTSTSVRVCLFVEVFVCLFV